FSLGETTGELLRSERRGLPDVDELRDLTRADLNANTTAGLELIKLEKQRRDHLLNSENTIAQIVAPLPPGDEKGRTEAAEAARRLPDSRLDLLDQLVTEYRTLTSTVSQTNRKRQTLILRTQAYAQLIDERVLWFRSAPVIGVEAIKDGIKSIVTIISPDRWTAFFRTLSNDFNSNWALWVAALLVIGLLLARRPAHKRQLEAASEIASKRTSLTYLPTAKALTYTILLSLPAPLALGFMAFRHGGIDGGGIATGLHEIAGQLLVFGFLRRVCYTDGLAVAHFRMLPHHARILHVTITKFLWLVLPAAFALGVLDSSDGHPGARLISISIMLVFVALILGLLKPSRKLVGTPVLQATAVCFGVVVPLVFVAAAAAGYFYTVRELQWRLEASLTLVLFLLLVSAMVQRWFVVARRSLAVAQAEHQHRASTESDSAPPESVALTQKEIESATVDITKIKDQTRQLLRSALAMALAVGLWGIWSNVLPALNILDEIHLWPDTTELATEQGTTTPQSPSPSPSPLQLPSAPTSDSTTSPPDAPASQPVSADFIALDGLATKTVDPNFGWVTLADVALSLLAFTLTYIAAKNIPGLLDISILSRLALKPGGSFAVTASARYLIVLVGVILAFAQIGVTWSKVQWIAAAVTVGIGFGLQEVFANFVAGLILLFERPIRLGDFVTIGTTSGQVTRIEIRATTIKDFSNKELIVPNKEFITGQLVNWTLTDSVIRVEIPVGIAYGSDTGLARQLLEEIGAAHPLAQSQPPAQAVFLNFGASSLDFELRVHTNSAQDLISVRNDLNFAIDKAFREHHIEIAFPQTDIHIRSMPPQPTPGA
ncbi:MAG: mechanosensitive ion channel, partial [Verrucomicrobiales bacterium]|nr:mechanosensitive ion channel [Verrucomicrobiales bacterium]